MHTERNGIKCYFLTVESQKALKIINIDVPMTYTSFSSFCEKTIWTKS